LLRIENGWSDEAIPNSINIGSMPATMRIRQTPYAPYTMPRIPPAEVARHRPFYSLVLDAQKIDGTWVVLMEHEPDYGDWTLMGLSGPIATAKEGDFQMGTMQQPRFYAWDIANQSILFVRGAPGSDEVDVWSYSMPSPNVTRFELNSGSYFEWQGDSYKPRAEFSKLVHWDFLKFLKGN
jgi:hypothetical protein